MVWDKICQYYSRLCTLSRREKGLRHRWDALAKHANSTPQLEAAKRAAAATPCQRKHLLWSPEEHAFLRHGLSSQMSPSAIFEAFVAEFGAAKRTWDAFYGRLRQLRTAMSADGRFESEEESDDMDEDDAREDADMTSPTRLQASRGAAEVSGAAQDTTGSGQRQQQPHRDVSGLSTSTTTQRAAAAAHVLGYGQMISRSYRGVGASDDPRSWSSADDD